MEVPFKSWLIFFWKLRLGVERGILLGEYSVLILQLGRNHVISAGILKFDVLNHAVQLLKLYL